MPADNLVKVKFADGSEGTFTKQEVSDMQALGIGIASTEDVGGIPSTTAPPSDAVVAPPAEPEEPDEEMTDEEIEEAARKAESEGFLPAGTTKEVEADIERRVTTLPPEAPPIVTTSDKYAGLTPAQILDQAQQDMSEEGRKVLQSAATALQNSELSSSAVFNPTTGQFEVPVTGDVGVEVPSDYEYSDEPYDVLVKMANEGASIKALLDYIEAHPDAVRGAYASRVVAKIQLQLQTVGKLKGEEQFNVYKKLGFLPDDAVYVQDKTDVTKWGYTSESSQKAASKFQIPQGTFGLTKQEQEYLKTNYPEIFNYYISEGITSAYEKYAKELGNAKVEYAITVVDPELLTIYKSAGGGQSGIDAVNNELANRQKEFEEQENLKSGYTQVSDGKGGLSDKWVANSDLAIIKASNPQLYSILTEQGYDAYIEAYKAYIKSIGSKLSDYEVNDKYDIDRALTTQDLTEKELIDFGFDPLDILKVKIRRGKIPDISQLTDEELLSLGYTQVGVDRIKGRVPLIDPAKQRDFEQEFIELPSDVQSSIIYEALYKYTDARDNLYDELPDELKKTVVDYYIYGVMPKEKLSDTNIFSNIAMGLVPVAGIEPSPIGEGVIVALLAIAGFVTILSQQENIARAVMNFREANGRNPYTNEVSVTGSSGIKYTLDALPLVRPDETIDAITITPKKVSVDKVNVSPAIVQTPVATIVKGFALLPKPSAVDSFVGGGMQTTRPQTAAEAMVGGGIQVMRQPTAMEGFVGGGIQAVKPSSAVESLIGGGMQTIRKPLASESFVGGGMRVVSPMVAADSYIKSVRVTTAVRPVILPWRVKDDLFRNVYFPDSKEGISYGVRQSYYRADSIQELDRMVYDAYTSGVLSQQDMESYKVARANYLAMKGIADNIARSQVIPQYVRNILPLNTISRALLVGLVTALVNAEKTGAKYGVDTLMQLATNIQQRSILNKLTDIAESTATQVQTATMEKEAIQTQTATQTAVQTAVQTATATTQAERATTAEAIREAISEATAEAALSSSIGGRRDKDKKVIKDEEEVPFTVSAIGWKQGALKRRGVVQRQYIVIRSPFKSEKDVSYVYGKPPKGVKIVDGIGSAYKSIAVITGQPPSFLLTLDMGIQDVTVSSKRGKVKLKFKRDVRQHTRSDIDLSQRGQNIGKI